MWIPIKLFSSLAAPSICSECPCYTRWLLIILVAASCRGHYAGFVCFGTPLVCRALMPRHVFLTQLDYRYAPPTCHSRRVNEDNVKAPLALPMVWWEVVDLQHVLVRRYQQLLLLLGRSLWAAASIAAGMPLSLRASPSDCLCMHQRTKNQCQTLST